MYRPFKPFHSLLVTYSLVLLLSCIFCFSLPLASEGVSEIPEVIGMQNLMQLSDKEALLAIEKLKPQTARELLSQIRHAYRKNNPQLDKLYYLLKHLERLQATSLAQKRLKNLLWVIGLTWLIFSIFFAYIMIDQKRIGRKFQKKLQNQALTKETHAQIYRGE